MNDKRLIIAGLVVFVVLVTFPFWANLGNRAPAPEPVLTERAQAAKVCILPAEQMKSEHMRILDLWRNEVVRHANRVYVADDGKEYMMSLSNTCLDCHYNKAEFCDSCHNYTAVNPYCWECHIEDPRGDQT